MTMLLASVCLGPSVPRSFTMQTFTMKQAGLLVSAPKGTKKPDSKKRKKGQDEDDAEDDDDDDSDNGDDSDDESEEESDDDEVPEVKPKGKAKAKGKANTCDNCRGPNVSEHISK